MEPAIAFCEVLRQQRISRGLTHKDLGLRAGLPGKYIYDLENGNEEPFLKTTHKLAAGLGFSTSGFAAIEVVSFVFASTDWMSILLKHSSHVCFLGQVHCSLFSVS